MESGTDLPPLKPAPGLTLPARRLDAGGHLRDLHHDHGLRLLRMIWWEHREGWNLLLRSLPNGVLFVPIDNRIRAEVAGATAVITPGTVAILPAGLPHAAGYPPGTRRRVDLLAIHLEVGDRLGRDFLRRYADPFRTLPDWPAWQRRLHAATEAFNGGGGDGTAHATATVRLLLSDLVIAPGRMQAASRMDPRIARCIELAQADRPAAPSVEDLARRIGLSSRRLRDLFLANTGMQPKDWLLRDRLAEAARLLCFTDRPVKDIAAALGFSSDHHFHAAFKQVHGTTPSAWRRAGGDGQS